MTKRTHIGWDRPHCTCGRFVSPRGMTCQHCGRPLDAKPKTTTRTSPKQERTPMPTPLTPTDGGYWTPQRENELLTSVADSIYSTSSTSVSRVRPTDLALILSLAVDHMAGRVRRLHAVRESAEAVPA